MNCPICDISLAGKSENEIQRHVNRCLDGGGDPPEPTPNNASPSFSSVPSVTVSSPSQPPRTFDEQNHQRPQKTGTVGTELVMSSQSESQATTPGAPLGAYGTPTTSGANNATSHGAPKPQFDDNSDDNDSLLPSSFTPTPAADVEGQSMEDNIQMLQNIMPQLPREAALQLLVDCGNNAEIAAATLIELAYGTSAMLPPVNGRNDDGANTPPPPVPDAKKAKKKTVGSTTPPAKKMAPVINSSMVELVVYDLAPDSIGKKVGMGAFHSGVHVFGREISFGGSFNMAEDAGRSGIFYCRPYTAMPNLKKKVVLGSIEGITWKDLWNMCEKWGTDDWRVDDYHMLSKNCNHFSDKFLRALAEYAVSVAPPPPSASGGEKDKDASTSSIDMDSVVEWSSLTEEEQKKKIKETFKLPNWVNRAASVGSKVVPEFIYKKMLQKLAPPGSTFEAPPTANDKKEEKKKKKDDKKKETTPPPEEQHHTPTLPAAHAKLSDKEGYPVPPPPPTAASPSTPLPVARNPVQPEQSQQSQYFDPSSQSDGLSPQDTTARTEMIDTMIAVTQVDRDRAVTLLAKHRWDLDRAVNACF